MIASIRLGLAALPADREAFFVWPADHPAVLVSTLERLAARASWERAVLPVTNGRRGHPALVGMGLSAAIAAIPERDGLRRLWRDMADAVQEIDVDDPGILENLDDPDAYERARLREETGGFPGGTGVP